MWIAIAAIIIYETYDWIGIIADSLSGYDLPKYMFYLSYAAVIIMWLIVIPYKIFVTEYPLSIVQQGPLMIKDLFYGAIASIILVYAAPYLIDSLITDNDTLNAAAWVAVIAAWAFMLLIMPFYHLETKPQPQT